MSSAATLTREQLEALPTARLLRVLRSVRVASSSASYEAEADARFKDEARKLLAQYKLVKDICATREHIT